MFQSFHGEATTPALTSSACTVVGTVTGFQPPAGMYAGSHGDPPGMSRPDAMSQFSESANVVIGRALVEETCAND
ncbi:MAG: hypothetical protein BWY06_00931 [Candidatus Latescibacteria bacterium ADurb.Bin168]|nr:MAG: hypothetical protein BWY06_00931 [Candidatus Latescibacteria bacterium ADurb.Bin168]